MSYELDQDLMDEQYEQNQKQSAYLQLPFDCPYLSWRHGNPDAEVATSKWFGRWSIDVADWDKFIASLDIPAPKEVETHPKKDKNFAPIPGEFYKIYTWRRLIFSVVASRTRWINKRSTTQSLVYLSRSVSGELQPMFPAVLTTKSWTADHMLKNVNKWLKYVGDFGINIPAHYFYMCIGTFGDTSEFAGSHGKETYPQLHINDATTKDNLPFVGNQVARKMAEIKVQSLDWLNDQEWLNPSANSDQQQRAQYQPTQPYLQDDEIPF